MSKILILPGDGIGTEIVSQAVKVINSLNANHSMDMNLVHGLIGGIAGLRLENNPSSERIPSNPLSGLKLLSNGSHLGPPTAPKSIESQSFAVLIVSSGSGDPVSS